MEIAMAVLKFVGGVIPLIQELLKAFMQVYQLAIIYQSLSYLTKKERGDFSEY